MVVATVVHKHYFLAFRLHNCIVQGKETIIIEPVHEISNNVAF